MTVGDGPLQAEFESKAIVMILSAIKKADDMWLPFVGERKTLALRGFKR